MPLFSLFSRGNKDQRESREYQGREDRRDGPEREGNRWVWETQWTLLQGLSLDQEAEELTVWACTHTFIYICAHIFVHALNYHSCAQVCVARRSPSVYVCNYTLTFLGLRRAWRATVELQDLWVPQVLLVQTAFLDHLVPPVQVTLTAFTHSWLSACLLCLCFDFVVSCRSVSGWRKGREGVSRSSRSLWLRHHPRI